MKIIIYDTEHFETTYSLIKIWDMPGNSITLFITMPVEIILKSILKKDAGRFKWVLVNPSIRFAYLFQLYDYLKKTKPEILFLNTVSYHHLFLALVCIQFKKTKKILTVHDANKLFSKQISINPRNIVQVVGKILLTKVVDGYATLLFSTKNYIISRFKIKKPVHYFPGGIFEKEKKNQFNINLPIRIVIPGSIEESRRDYYEVLQLMNLLEQSKITINLIFLGKPIGNFGKQFISRLKKLNPKFITITYFEDFVRQEEYDNHLQQCDFVLTPLQKITPTENIAEEYGISKATGGFFDAIKYAKPILVPKDIFLSEEIKNQCIAYTSIYELKDFLYNLTLHPEKYYDIKSKVLNNSMNFTKEKIRSENKDLFN